MSFRLDDYIRLLEALRGRGYMLSSMDAWFDGVEPPCVLLRHDVDRFPSRSVALGEAEHRVEVTATYYVRCDKKGRFPEDAIARLLSSGHGIGYHYETLVRTKGDMEAALRRFREELAVLRRLAPVRSAAMHGTPLTPHNNRDIWRQTSPADFDLDGEAYESVDFSRVLYLTDTGGCFNAKTNMRDKVSGLRLDRAYGVTELPDVLIPARYPFVVLSTHPERWPASFCGFVQAWGMDRAVNIVKRLLRAAKRPKEVTPC